MAESTLQNSPQSSTQSQGEEIEIDINQDNVKFILMDGFEYSFNRMLDDAQKWKCTNASCYAYFKILGNQILPGVMAHTHQREVESAVIEENEGTTEEQNVEPVEQRTERPLGTRTYPAKAKKYHSQSSWPESDSCGAVAKKQKPVSGVAEKEKMSCGESVMRRSPPIPPASPDSGYILDQDSSSSSQLAASGSVADPPAKSPSSFLLAAHGSGAASPGKSPSPPKSPKLSEMGPPPTPPLSQHSSQRDSDPSSPLPPVYDLAEAKYPPSSFSPDIGVDYMEPPPESPVNNPQTPAAQPSTSSSSRKRQIQSSELRKKRQKLARFKEFENLAMKLNSVQFGLAVGSLLCFLPQKTAEDIQYEIATLLFEASEEHTENSCQCDPSQT